MWAATVHAPMADHVDAVFSSWAHEIRKLVVSARSLARSLARTGITSATPRRSERSCEFIPDRLWFICMLRLGEGCANLFPCVRVNGGQNAGEDSRELIGALGSVRVLVHLCSSNQPEVPLAVSCPDLVGVCAHLRNALGLANRTLEWLGTLRLRVGATTKPPAQRQVQSLPYCGKPQTFCTKLSAIRGLCLLLCFPLWSLQEVIDDALYSLQLLVTDDASIEDFVCMGGLQVNTEAEGAVEKDEYHAHACTCIVACKLTKTNICEPHLQVCADLLLAEQSTRIHSRVSWWHMRMCVLVLHRFSCPLCTPQPLLFSIARFCLLSPSFARWLSRPLLRAPPRSGC